VPFEVEEIAIEVPEVPERVPALAPEARAAFDRMRRSNDGAMVVGFLKAVVATQGGIARRSEEAEKVGSVMLGLIAANSSHAVQGVRHITTLVASSRAFALEFAMKTVADFRELCNQHNPFQLAGQIVALWGSVVGAGAGEAALLNFVRATGVLGGLCGLFELAGLDNGISEVVELITAVIEFLKVAVAFLHRQTADDCGFPGVVAPAILGFFRAAASNPGRFKTESLVTAARVLSSLAVDFGEAVVVAVDEQLAASLVHVLKTFLGNTNATLLPVTHELIILFGLLCRWSSVFRESCTWLPPPTLLAKLCELPLSYFVQKAQAAILVPTLVACCLDNEENARIVLGSVSGILIAKFVKGMETKDTGIAAPQHRIPRDRVAELVAVFGRSPL
jgi:hypothetical protein